MDDECCKNENSLKCTWNFYLWNVEENKTFGIPKSKEQANNKIYLNAVRWYGSKYKPVSGIFD